MRLRHIEVFQAIRQSGSVSGAAQLLHVSQPAVTKVLQHAELQLGFPLFLRVRGKLQPTPEALELEREIAKVSESLKSVRRLAQNLRNNPGRTLRVGATPALALALLPQLMPSWLTRFPQSGCELSTHHTRELVQGLMMRELDVGLTLKQPDHPGLAVRTMTTGALVALAPSGFWAGSQAGVPLPIDALADTPLIGLSTDDPLSALLEHHLAVVEPPPRIRLAVQTYPLARALVEAGAGVAIVDPFTALGADPAATMIRPLAPVLPMTLYALTRIDETPSHPMTALLELVAVQAGELVKQAGGSGRAA
ncbi:LysR family transcriptional regulator [Jeongeupia naejangsanensis]|uniref:LysR family transcriptional regulator n=1 Tax=Jeongeupia naejangsanensis TaxID=613195 RepID=A0ABS2BLL7_9NEIS|nr:LysR family transcriptional regulator [Jeongeupia naejangsanensis]MBM3116473.1 LysR family transcriptional regulator [Jeongeupia naejangsanensis]